MWEHMSRIFQYPQAGSNLCRTGRLRNSILYHPDFSTLKPGRTSAALKRGSSISCAARISVPSSRVEPLPLALAVSQAPA